MKTETVEEMKEMEGIEICNLSQGYGKRIVLENLSFSLPAGKIIGLLGPNGAGKTTLMHTLATVLPPRAGSISVLAQRLDNKKERRKIRANLGYLPQNFTFDGFLTVQEFVEYHLWMRSFPKAEIKEAATSAIKAVDLAEDSKRKMRVLSGGMRQRAGIAAAIAGKPALLMLDEPTAGLDPAQRAAFRDVLRGLHSTVLLSTHLIEDINACAEHLVVINKGIIIHNGSPDILVKENNRSVEGLEAEYLRLINNA